MLKSIIGGSLWLLASPAQARETPWSVKAWQSLSADPAPSDFPETDSAELMSRPSVGIGFTGGGSRSFLASAGYMSALHELGKRRVAL